MESGRDGSRAMTLFRMDEKREMRGVGLRECEGEEASGLAPHRRLRCQQAKKGIKHKM